MSRLLVGLVCIVLVADVAQAQFFDYQINDLVGNFDSYVAPRTFNTSTSVPVAIISGIGAIILIAAATIFIYSYTASSRIDKDPTYFSAYPNQYYQNAQYQQRSNDVYDFSSFNVLEWIAVMRDMYENFDMNDLECQKRLICEVARSEDTFGRMSRNLRTGFKYAKYLEMLNLPDDFREVLDEYMDASEQAEGPKDCREFFQCPYSIKDSLNRNLSNHL